jgi:uncharacterized membrane protein YwaF
MFWVHGEDLPAGVGGEPFCPAHLAYLAVFLAATVCYAFFYQRLDEGRRRIADRVLGSLVFFFGLCEYGITALLGRFSLYTLPIHVCSLMFSLSLLHAWTNAARPGSFAGKLHGFLGAVIFHPGILGTWAALLFPDWLYYPFWNYLSISSFLVHGLISIYGASLLVRIAEAPEGRALLRRDLRDTALFMLLGAALMYLFDRATDTNYWFMAGPGYGSPFAGVYAQGGFGAYLLAYALTAALITALWYGLRYFLFVRGRNRHPGGTDRPPERA